MELHNPTSLSTIKVLLGSSGAHIERRAGTAQQARDYFAVPDGKSGETLLEAQEFGQLSHQGKRSDLDEVIAAVKEGASRQALAELYPAQIVKYGQGLKRLKEDLKPAPEPYSRKYVEYHYGPPGIGKSSGAIANYPGAYAKDCDTKWWDNYEGQDVVRMDDFPGAMTCILAKKWLGEVNVPLEWKCGSTEMRYTKVIITSNDAPEDCFQQAKDVHRAAFMRRLSKIVKYAWCSAPLTDESRALGYTSERVITVVRE